MDVVDKYGNYDDAKQTEDAEQVPNINHRWVVGTGHIVVDLLKHRNSVEGTKEFIKKKTYPIWAYLTKKKRSSLLNSKINLFSSL